ncbi:peroxisome biogenesis factor 1 isoform X2 [Belonocnema kinseyi]|nr:peroxisome biogenesis factor 1 isoform X2 [Belonocnema kinseyi]
MVVDFLDPNFRYGKLNEHSEVHVKDAGTKTDAKHKSKSRDTQDRSTGSGIWSVLNKHLPSIFTDSSDAAIPDMTPDEIQAELDKYLNISPPQTFRAHEILKIVDTTQTNASEVALRCPYNVFVRQCHLPLSFDSTQDNLFKIRKVLGDARFVRKKNIELILPADRIVPHEPTELIVKLLCLEDHLEQCSTLVDKEYFASISKQKIIYISPNLAMNLKLSVGGKVLLETFPRTENSVSSVELFPIDEAVTSEIFEDYIKERSKYERVLMNSCSRILFDNGNVCILKISPECKYSFFDADCLKNLKVHVNEVIETKKDESLSDGEDEENVELRIDNISMRIFDEILSECKLTLDLSLGLHNIKGLEYDRENILICGDVGSGKTTVCRILEDKLRKPPHFIHTRRIDCKRLKGKRVDPISKIIESVLKDCVFHQYSVLFLDDLEFITNASQNEEEATPDSTNATRITEMIIELVTKCQAVHEISLIATCADVNKIGEKMRAPRGIHFFRTLLSIPVLKKEDRIEVLQLSLKDKLEVSSEIDWDNYGNKTEGWMVEDIVDMAEKAAFTAYKRHVGGNLKSSVTLLGDDLSSALDRSKPRSLQGVNLYKGPGYSWSDIGGLVNVKRSLIEILHWPLKYPEIFKNAPIKLQSGVLLYGMPGTGKTMLAGAIAKECGLNMITVKGPELLSKYIGASEESVRNIFEKAKRAKPCVLFFDEFDSLAPRRGNDSTGVTDRVVNQLLTQLDGVEGREGVSVVAATSRPDLLDPALLRPGRLDKCLLCPLPDDSEREEILRALFKSNRINTESLDLKELATLSTGYTGADLKGVLTQARLVALEEALETATPEEKKKVDGRNLTQKHLLDSLKSTRPSLTTAEKDKYTFVYSRFTKGSGMPSENLPKQKATLA